MSSSSEVESPEVQVLDEHEESDHQGLSSSILGSDGNEELSSSSPGTSLARRLERYEMRAEGNSSDEDNDDRVSSFSDERKLGEGSFPLDDDDAVVNGDDAAPANEYALLDDEFEEFQSASDYVETGESTNRDACLDQRKGEPNNTITQQDSKSPINNDSTTASSSVNIIEQPPHVSIPPLSQDKIDTIKQAMARLNLKPNPGADAIFVAMERAKLRIGDEFDVDMYCAYYIPRYYIIQQS